MDPVLSLILILLTPTINPGEPIQIEVFITGTGNITSNKFFIQYSSELIDIQDPGFLKFSIGEQELENGTRGPITGNEYFKVTEKEEAPLSPNGVIGYFVDTAFMEHPRKQGEFEIPTIIGEWRWDGYPPLLININTDNDASGDYDINFSITYTDGEIMKISKEGVTIHVRSTMERYGFPFAILGIVLAIIKGEVILDFLVNGIGKIFQYLIAKIN